MNLISKENLTSFLEYYHYFHDSNILNINYDIKTMKIELIIDVYWSGEPIKKEDNSLETNKTKLRMVFKRVYECNNKELFPYDSIDCTYMKSFKLRDKDLICFSNDEKEPTVYVVSESIEYEEIK